MAPIPMAWGDLNLYELPDGSHVWGREVQALPAGSMFGAAGALHGLVGVAAEPLNARQAQVRHDAPLLIYGVRGTEPEQLRPHQDDLVHGFNARSTQHQA